jgi:ribosome-associated toxin RatA of RatAB toxin-antitoxin module
MNRTHFGLRLSAFALIFALLILPLALPGETPDKPVPRAQLPKDEAGIARMMKISWTQEVLPPGGRPEVLHALLERGQVVLINDHHPVVPWMSAVGILIDAPPSVVFEVFSDFAKFPEYLPMTEKTVVTPLAPNLVDVQFTVNVKMAFLSYSITYSCYHYNRPAIYRTDWCLSAGEFKNNSGFYQAIPVDDGKRAMLWYSVHSEPDSSFVRSLYNREPTLELMTNVSAATMVVRALKKRAEDVYQHSPGYQALPKRGPGRPIQQTLLSDPQTLKLLAERGKILVLEDGPTVYVTAGTMVNATPEQAFDIVSRFVDAPIYIPGVRKVEEQGQGEKGPKYYWYVEMNLAFLTYKYEYNLEYQMNRPRQITWMIPRAAGDTPGFWQFVPLDQGQHCLIFNGATADIRAMGFIPRYALKVEPTLEHALIASQGTIAINATKDYIQQQIKNK